ncbi:SLAM family member 5 isoform X2 [Puntigrus tetrazona]|uniref:SLAM family member 5 isoform X2 n=1 Tax=Puntigrus tetrazona TaxID=1606681 RepID=UPI001C895894|nr:SLAM family member 5 isoform X2 [Puntigrus tetrazona]
MKKLKGVFNLFVWVILSRFHAVSSIIYVEDGKSVTLNPNIQGNPEDILWTFNGNKAAERDLNEFLEYGQFRGRSEIDISTGQLTVLRATSQDSGVYKSAVQIDGKLQMYENEVRVIDAVQEPNVTCTLNNVTESKTLFCSVSSRFLTTFEWTGSNSLKRSGQELDISKVEKPDSVFICTVKNEVSQKSTSFTLKDCPEGKPPHENVILPVIIIIACVVIIVGSAAAIYFIYRRRNKGKKGEDLNHAVRNNYDLEDNAEQDTNEDRDEFENDEETEMMSGNEYREEANQALRSNHVSEDSAEEDLKKDKEETEMMHYFKCSEDVAENYEEQDINQDEE